MTKLEAHLALYLNELSTTMTLTSTSTIIYAKNRINHARAIGILRIRCRSNKVKDILPPFQNIRENIYIYIFVCPKYKRKKLSFIFLKVKLNANFI